MPLLALAPTQEPLAVHDVGLFVADQEIVEELPDVIDIGLAVIVTTGAGGKLTTSGIFVTLVVPPAFVQDRPYK